MVSRTWEPQMEAYKAHGISSAADLEVQIGAEEREAGCKGNGQIFFWHVQAFGKLYIQICDRRLNVWKKLRSIKS